MSTLGDIANTLRSLADQVDQATEQKASNDQLRGKERAIYDIEAYRARLPQMQSRQELLEMSDVDLDLMLHEVRRLDQQT